METAMIETRYTIIASCMTNNGAWAKTTPGWSRPPSRSMQTSSAPIARHLRGSARAISVSPIGSGRFISRFLVDDAFDDQHYSRTIDRPNDPAEIGIYTGCCTHLCSSTCARSASASAYGLAQIRSSDRESQLHSDVTENGTQGGSEIRHNLTQKSVHFVFIDCGRMRWY